LIASIILFHKIVTNSTYHQNITAIEHNGEGKNSCIKEFFERDWHAKAASASAFSWSLFPFLQKSSTK